jgi:hypothetical protein
MHQGLLFTREFLRHGIADTPAWEALTEDAVAGFRARVLELFQVFPVNGAPNEAQTEADLIFKILEALDWAHYLPQQSASARRRTDVPDALLFAVAEDKARANAERGEAARYRHGIVIVENKAWRLPLDRASRGRDMDDGVPSTQILRYLSVAEVQSNRRIQWGILTNGQHWRLYYQLARSRAEEFLELDLPAVLGVEGFDGGLFALTPDEQDHWLRVFILLFRRQAFVDRNDDGHTFHQIALNRGRWWEEKVAKDLSHPVFTEIFPSLIRGIVANDPDAPPGEPDSSYLDQVKQAALILLYRLLFVLYAEDRNLLPVDSQHYRNYSLRFSVREPVAELFDQRLEPSTTAARFYGHVKDLFRAIGKGDAALRLPPYNGGLFDPERAALLERVNLPDSVFGPIIDKLSRQNLGLFKRRINFRDLSVQQLGSIMSAYWSSSRSARMAASTSVSIPLPARTAAASTRRKNWSA